MLRYLFMKLFSQRHHTTFPLDVFQFAAWAEAGAGDVPAGPRPGGEEGGDGQQGGEAPQDGEAPAGEGEKLRPLLRWGEEGGETAEQILFHHQVDRLDCNHGGTDGKKELY